MNIWLDVETRARVSVVDVGVYAHAPTIEKMLVIRYALGDEEEPREWLGVHADGADPESADAPPQDLIDAVKAGGMIYAHNAAYERVTLRDGPLTWWPDVPIEQFVCTAAWAASFNLPRALGMLSRTLLPAAQAKLTDVAAGVKFQWSTQNPIGTYADTEKQSLYCGQDVTSMRDCMRCLPDVDPDWLAQYHAAEHVNDTGVMLDVDLADAVTALVPEVQAELLTELQFQTGGAVNRTRGPQLMNWLEATLPEDLLPALEIVEKYKVGYGFKSKKRRSAGQKARDQLLEAIEDRTDTGSLRAALSAFEEANKAAVGKFAAASKRVSDDGALRGQYMMAGAGQTGRFSSMGVQIHNLKRNVATNATEIIRELKGACGHAGVIPGKLGMTVNEAASGVLRPMFVAEDGRVLTWCDWSSIEARMLPWLSKDKRAEAVLDIFRSGGDIYITTAAGILHIKEADVGPEERQAYGKVPTLALGYQGGVGAFQAMAGGYGVQIEDAEADRIKEGWRMSNPWAPVFWDNLERAAINALDAPLDMIPAGRINYQFVPDLLGGTLLAWLPSGRWLAYPEAKVVGVDKFDSGHEEPALVFNHPTYGGTSTYGGSLAENVTQAESATLLREALVDCVGEGLDVVMHTHDEIVIESDVDKREDDAALLSEIMHYVPDWAEGLPIDADAGHGVRYKVPDIATGKG